MYSAAQHSGISFACFR